MEGIKIFRIIHSYTNSYDGDTSSFLEIDLEKPKRAEKGKGYIEYNIGVGFIDPVKSVYDESKDLLMDALDFTEEESKELLDNYFKDDIVYNKSLVEEIYHGNGQSI